MQEYSGTANSTELRFFNPIINDEHLGDQDYIFNHFAKHLTQLIVNGRLALIEPIHAHINHPTLPWPLHISGPLLLLSGTTLTELTKMQFRWALGSLPPSEQQRLLAPVLRHHAVIGLAWPEIFIKTFRLHEFDASIKKIYRDYLYEKSKTYPALQPLLSAILRMRPKMPDDIAVFTTWWSIQKRAVIDAADPFIRQWLAWFDQTPVTCATMYWNNHSFSDSCRALPLYNALQARLDAMPFLTDKELIQWYYHERIKFYVNTMLGTNPPPGGCHEVARLALTFGLNIGWMDHTNASLVRLGKGEGIISRSELTRHIGDATIQLLLQFGLATETLHVTNLIPTTYILFLQGAKLAIEKLTTPYLPLERITRLYLGLPNDHILFEGKAPIDFFADPIQGGSPQLALWLKNRGILDQRGFLVANEKIDLLLEGITTEARDKLFKLLRPLRFDFIFTQINKPAAPECSSSHEESQKTPASRASTKRLHPSFRTKSPSSPGGLATALGAPLKPQSQQTAPFQRPRHM